MKLTFFSLVGSMLMSANAHYFFDRLLINDHWSDPWEYIRKIRPAGTENPPTDYNYIIPIVDPSSLDLRCGRNATTAWSRPKIAVLRAGDKVGFAVNTTVGLAITGAVIEPWDRYPNLYHPGPATAWLSKAPGRLEDYEGDGVWFKILSVVGRTEQSVVPDDAYYWKQQWGTYQARNWTFNIPAKTPPGDYLLRFEAIYPLPKDVLQGTQFYTNCAHVRILNHNHSNIGTPGPTVKIPGVYTFGQKEIYFYTDVGTESYNISDFVEPAPKVWVG